MEIIHYFERTDHAALIGNIKACDWRAAQFLAVLPEKDRFHKPLGGWGYLFMLMDGENLVSTDRSVTAMISPWDKHSKNGNDFPSGMCYNPPVATKRTERRG